MTRAYQALLHLYPYHVRALYGDEMIAGFGDELQNRRRRGRAATAVFLARELLRLLPDAAAERVATFGSHPSFRGRCLRDLGVVRPPNAAKGEWFYSEEVSDTANRRGPRSRNPSCS